MSTVNDLINDQWPIERIIASHHRVDYKVQRVGCEEDHRWDSAEELNYAQDKLREFHQADPVAIEPDPPSTSHQPFRARTSARKRKAQGHHRHGAYLSEARDQEEAEGRAVEDEIEQEGANAMVSTTGQLPSDGQSHDSSPAGSGRRPGPLMMERLQELFGPLDLDVPPKEVSK
ncbi:MAG: hypothetical protein L6R38_005923 [Xanthoria sp. 2 TBL-2021]|nr:MAG: hypothetical protein L6R38_005923 [Xanthoria sp. 2 TBL-2021]